MLGAGATRRHHSRAERGTRPEDPYPGIVRADASLLREGLNGLALEIDLLERLRVLRLERLGGQSVRR